MMIDTAFGKEKYILISVFEDNEEKAGALIEERYGGGYLFSERK